VEKTKKHSRRIFGVNLAIFSCKR